MLRKTFVFCVFLLFLFVLSSFAKNVTYAAQCDARILINGNEVEELDPNFKGNINIKSNNSCFSTDKTNDIIICPNIEGENENIYDRCTVLTISGTNSATDLSYSSGTPITSSLYSNQKSWIVKVCELTRALDIPARDCNGDPSSNSNIIVYKELKLSNAAIPPPAPNNIDDLPEIDRAAQTQCIYKMGSAITINKIKGLKPNTKYEWWWNGDFRGNEIPTILTNNKTEITDFRIFRQDQVDKLNKQTFCIDIEGRGMRGCAKADARNGITLKFEKGALPADTSCNNPDLKKDDSHPAPPCLQWLDINGRPLSPNDPRIDKADGIKKCASVDTAIGPINTNPSDFVRKLLAIILSLSGGIALLLIIFSGYKLMTSQGNPEKLQGARETLTSAIVGLLLIIFSLVIIELIGVDILHLPGFSR